jgi:hypothetical protein
MREKRMQTPLHLLSVSFLSRKKPRCCWEVCAARQDKNDTFPYTRAANEWQRDYSLSLSLARDNRNFGSTHSLVRGARVHRTRIDFSQANWQRAKLMTIDRALAKSVPASSIVPQQQSPDGVRVCLCVATH